MEFLDPDAVDLFTLENPRFEVLKVKSQSTCIQLEAKVARGNVPGTLTMPTERVLRQSQLQTSLDSVTFDIPVLP